MLESNHDQFGRKDDNPMLRLDKGNLEEQETYQQEKLEPRLAGAQAGEWAVFFVDAAHVCSARFWITVWGM